MLLLTILLLFAGCGETQETAPPVQPVEFYYRTATTDFSAADGVIRAEVRDLGAESYTDLELLELYFKGPVSKELVSPFSSGIEVAATRRRGGTLEIYLTWSTQPPTELDRSIACACVARTALALDGILKVRICVSSPTGQVQDDVLLTENDLRLFDSGEAPESMEVTLYYADEAGDFLLTEKRSVPLISAEALPRYVLELLMEPPQSAGMRSPLPPGTAILDTSMNEGTFTVDFNADFANNRPSGEQAEQLALLSVVNTLCALENVDQVQLYAEGRVLSPYVWLDLSEPWLLDTAPVGPVRQELGEFAATLCLPGADDGLLHRITVRARARGGASREEALLQTLIARTPQNGLAAPLSGAELPESVLTVNRICTVDLATGTLPEETLARELTIRCVTATLCSLPEVDAVQLQEQGTPVTYTPRSPTSDWFAAP